MNRSSGARSPIYLGGVEIIHIDSMMMCVNKVMKQVLAKARRIDVIII
jgi:hypothetical protein